MRVLLCIQRLWRGGGTETHVLTLAYQLKSRGHHVEVLTSGGEWVPKIRQLGISVRIVSDIGVSNHAVRKAFRHYVKRRRFDVVHVHDGPTLTLVARAFAGHRHMPPVIFTMHGPYVTAAVLRRANRSARRVICVSPELARVYRQRVSHGGNKVSVISNGIRQDVFRKNRHIGNAFRSRYGISRHAFVIGYSGRFTFDKIALGKRIVSVLRDYARTHRSVRVVVAGRNSKSTVASSYPVIVAGHVENMSAFYNACDVVVGTARVATEAVFCGIPTIALGKSSLVGNVSPRRLNRALSSNFGDHGPLMKWTNDALRNEVHSVRKSHRQKVRDAKQVRKYLVKKGSAGHMTREIERIYRRVRHNGRRS